MTKSPAASRGGHSRVSSFQASRGEANEDDEGGGGQKQEHEERRPVAEPAERDEAGGSRNGEGADCRCSAR